VWTSRASRARVSYVEESLAEGFSHIRSRVPFAAQEAYTVHGLQSAATVEQLRLAGDDYPEWVVARYLQLPDEVPERVHRLAHTIAATATNAYDRAAAVEAYLRQTITYNDDVAAPPPDRDAVDYVLFDLRQGYCDYYASAMVVLLRALGIPGRMAAGYAQGEYDYAKRAFVVRQRDAHAWPEVFFPHYGWVEFEPTSARPPRRTAACHPPHPGTGAAAITAAGAGAGGDHTRHTSDAAPAQRRAARPEPAGCIGRADGPAGTSGRRRRGRAVAVVAARPLRP
jgi:transglutaminase-like putative cysteine protease